MSPKDTRDILKKALNKAIDNGWNRYLLFEHKNTHLEIDDDTTTGWHERYILVCDDLVGKHAHELGSKYDIIFDKYFAKAVWGNELDNINYGGLCYVCGYDGLWPPKDIESWQIHMQNMVTSNDPIKYLGEHLND